MQERAISPVTVSPRAAVARAAVSAVLGRCARVRTFLDARCGDGLVALIIARHFPAIAVTAHDVDAHGIARARSRSRGARVRFEVSDSLKLHHFELDVATVCIDLDATPDAFPLLVSLRNAVARDGLVLAAAEGGRARDLPDLATSAGFSRVTASDARGSSLVLELRR